MCGILCVLQTHADTDAQARELRCQVLKRVARLRHRGPDWSGVHASADAILAHERLAINDVSSGMQPLSNKYGTVWLAVNGEIWNHATLYAALEQENQSQSMLEPLQTKSDCECIIPLYEFHRIQPDGLSAMLNKLRGMFAFVLSDERTQRYVVARDHIGIVPLFWGIDASGALWFASEMKGLHDACVTFSEVLPGQYWDSDFGRDEQGKPNFQQWYKPVWYDATKIPTNALDLTTLREALISSVEQHLMTDVPIGVLLSGGLDSSLIASITMRLLRARDENAQLHSFSVGLEDSPDLKAARVVATYLGTVHHEIVFTVEQGLDAIPEVIKALETYDVTTVRAGTPMWLMARRVKSLGFSVVLSGEGSDEIFGSYAYFRKCPNATEHHLETVRKLKALHMFDNLRANKAMAAWGIEARVPFLGVDFLEHCMERMSPKDKICGRAANSRIEKWAIREAFRGFLSDDMLWRVKEQFSDGVGIAHIDGIKAHAKCAITDAQMQAARYRFPHNTPPTKEAYWFRSLFEDHYPEHDAAHCVPGGPSVACSTAAALEWEESLRECIDPSGRAIRGEHAESFLPAAGTTTHE